MTRRQQVIGLVVNPVAGIGGPAALKGSDGARVQSLARDRGSSSRAQARATEAIRNLHGPVLTSAGPMGELSVLDAGLPAEVVHAAVGPETSAADTSAAVRALADAGATLILFAGGDGTAGDVAAAMEGRSGVAALGIPCGVKMYSPVFAVSPAVAGRMAAAWQGAAAPRTEIKAVLDIDEDEVRAGRVVPRPRGELQVPVAGGRTQARKVAAEQGPGSIPAGIASAVADRLRLGSWLLGPGSTMEAVAAELGIAKTPLGVDVVHDGTVVLADADEEQLVAWTAEHPSRAVLTVIGGQGFLLGRGNQQLSGRVLAHLATPALLVVATPDKLRGLTGPLLIDTGDDRVDAALSGYHRIITGVQDTAVVRAVAASTDQTLREE